MVKGGFCLHHGQSTTTELRPSKEHVANCAACTSNLNVQVKKKKGVCQNCRNSFRNMSKNSALPKPAEVSNDIFLFLFLLIKFQKLEH